MIHKTAIIDAGARLGSDVTIGPYSCVETDVEIGDGCVIGPRVNIMRHTVLGPGCEVHAGAVLGGTPQDMDFEECESGAKFGKNCVIREGVTVHRGTKPGTLTEVGDGCWLMAYSHLAHNVRLEPGVIVVNGTLLAGYVQVGSRAFISGNCGVHQFVRIGRLAMLGGHSVATQDVPPFCMTRTVSLNRLAGLNVVGMRRAGLTAEERREIKKAFDILFRSGLNTSQAVAEVRSALTSPRAAELCDFVAASQRGICSLKP